MQPECLFNDSRLLLVFMGSGEGGVKTLRRVSEGMQWDILLLVFAFFSFYRAEKQIFLHFRELINY